MVQTRTDIQSSTIPPLKGSKIRSRRLQDPRELGHQRRADLVVVLLPAAVHDPNLRVADGTIHVGDLRVSYLLKIS